MSENKKVKIEKEVLEKVFDFIIKTSPDIMCIEDVFKRIELAYDSIKFNSKDLNSNVV